MTEVGISQSEATGQGWEGGLSAALAQVGDRWALLVVSALLAGPLRFGELQDRVRGVASNILSDRLKRLEGHGVVVARLYSERPPRFDYELTATGMELAGALRLLASWGLAAAGSDDHARHARHDACGTPLEARLWCPTCDTDVDADRADVRWV